MENIATSENVAEIPQPKPSNAAVQRCCEAFFCAMASPKRGDMDWEVKAKAGDAYRRAMPFLNGGGGPSDFLDCVTHGIVLGVFEAHESSRLLNAVTVAQSRASKAARNPAKNPGAASEAPAENQ